MAANGMAIHGTYDYENQYLDEKAPREEGRAYDSAKYDIWARRPDRADRQILATVKKHITHVDQSTFERTLEGCLDKFKEKILNDPYVALVEPEKSQSWATAIGIEKGITPEFALRLGEQGADMLENSLRMLDDTQFDRVGEMENILIVDDGSFTGNQMANNISGANRIFNERYGTAPRKFHVVVPYMTKVARDKMYSAKEIVHLYTDKVPMQVLGKIFPRRNELKRGLELLEVQESRANSTALTYFDHKIPNSMSFPAALERGGFIPSFCPPYKEEL